MVEEALSYSVVLLAKSVENLVKRKASGGRRRALRGRRAYERDGYSVETGLGEDLRAMKRIHGGKIKVALRSIQYATVVDLAAGKASKVKILRVVKNPANRDYERRGVITKGAVIETEQGLARVVSRPGQDGVVNAILVR